MAGGLDDDRKGFLTALLLAVFLGVVAVGAWSARQRGKEEGPAPRRPPASDNPDPAVGITLSCQADGLTMHSLTLPYAEGATVFDFMVQAAAREPIWKFRHVGRGTGAFLDQLAGRENEGAGRRNWTYQVNDEIAAQSFGAYQLAPGDHVLWKYAPPE